MKWNITNLDNEMGIIIIIIFMNEDYVFNVYSRFYGWMLMFAHKEEIHQMSAPPPAPHCVHIDSRNERK